VFLSSRICCPVKRQKTLGLALAYLAEDYAALYAMECERDGIGLETD